MRHPLRQRSRLLHSEDGFALVEIIVSAVLLIILATATLSVMDHSSQATAGNRARASAVAMAQADQDTMRQTPVQSLTGRHLTYEKTSDGTTFTIVSDAVWLRDASGQVTCSAGTSRAEYLKITSSVTWVGHPQPVVLESYIAPGVSALQNGALTLRLKGDVGTGTGGIPASASLGGVSASGTTDTNGCVVLANLQPGSNTLNFGAAGYVDRNGAQNVTETVSIVTAATAQIERLYDRAAGATATFVDQATGTAGPQWTSLSATNIGITSPANQTRVFPNLNSSGATIFGPTVAAGGLFPFAAPYSFYAGNCTGNAPGTWLGSATMPTATPAPGTTNATVSVPMAATTILATTNGLPTGTKKLGMSIGVDRDSTSSKMTGCTETILRASGIAGTALKTDTTTGLKSFNLPYGRWRICVDDGTNRAYRVLNHTPAGTASPDARSLDLTTGVPAGSSLVVNFSSSNSTYGTGRCA